MKSLLAVFVLLSLCVGLAACGSSTPEKHAPTSSSSASTSAAPTATAGTTTTTGDVSAPRSIGSLKGDEDDDETSEHLSDTSKDNDADFDNDLKPQPGYDDSDDGPVRNYGHAAGAAQEARLKGIVTRYFAAAAKGDGKTGCTLIDAHFVTAIPEDYGRGAGPAYSRGNTCPVVLSAIFKHAHAQLSGRIRVTAVRIQGAQALVLVGSTTMAAGYVSLQRTGGVWGIVGLLGTPMP